MSTLPQSSLPNPNLLLNRLPNINPIFQNQQFQPLYDVSAKITLTVTIIGILAFLMIIIAKRSFSTLQIIINMQIAFFSLGSLTKISPITSGLLNSLYITGFNTKITQIQLFNTNFVHHQNILALQHETSFFNNFNVMLFIQITFLLISLTLFLINYFKGILENVFKNFQRGSLFIILFNFTNVMFSISLMNYDRPLQIIIAFISFSMIIVQISHVIAKHRQYLGVSFNFKNQPYNFGFYLVGFFIFKSVPCIIIGCLKHQPFMISIMILVFQLIACVFLVFIRAFQRKICNIFSLISEFILLVFLLINLVFGIIRQTTDSTNINLQLGLSWFQFALYIILSLCSFFLGTNAIYREYYLKEQQWIINQYSNNLRTKQGQQTLGSPENIKSVQFHLDKQMILQKQQKNEIKQDNYSIDQNVQNQYKSQKSHKSCKSQKIIFKNHQKPLHIFDFMDDYQDECNDDQNNCKKYGITQNDIIFNQNLEQSRKGIIKTERQYKNENNQIKTIMGKKRREIKSLKFKQQLDQQKY